MKRRGNRRYYQHHEVLMIRRIRELLYEQGFTINGARNRLRETSGAAVVPSLQAGVVVAEPVQPLLGGESAASAPLEPAAVREELLQIRSLLSI
jgi:DNA-binding transcriptional MerR regulator